MIQTVLYLICDRCGAVKEAHLSDPSFMELQESLIRFRDHGAEMGFLFMPKQDLCPNCANKHKVAA